MKDTSQTRISALQPALLLLALLASPVAAEVRYATFTSPALGREVSYAVDLPPSYASGDRRYPVLYALHGLFENHTFWERRGLAGALQALRDKGEVPDFLVIALDGGNSFFVNGPAGRFEDLVTSDVVAHVEKTYRATPGREGRALFGVSMGGYAALRIALERPELFRAAATHSAMLLEKIPTADQGARRGQMAAFNAAFGDPIDPALWSRADPLAWAEKADPKAVPGLYFDCGSEDRYGLAEGNQDLDRRLTAHGIAHTFALHPGDHGYAYVLTVLDRSLKFVGAAFGSAAPAGPARPRITLQSAKVPSLIVSYLSLPWGPNTFATMEKAGDTFYNKRLWPFAQLTTETTVSLEGTPIPPGRYALLFHPNGPTNQGMSLEVRAVDADFLEPGNAMAPAPEGKTVLRVPARFETVADTAPALAIALDPGKGVTSLTVRYGDRRLVKELKN